MCAAEPLLTMFSSEEYTQMAEWGGGKLIDLWSMKFDESCLLFQPNTSRAELQRTDTHLLQQQPTHS